MDTQLAAEHLQTIRTLMERSALYRRALAPIMIYVGLVGIAAGMLAEYVLPIQGARAFALFWMGVAAIAVAGALLLVRRQALKQGEPFWSPPTRRVAQAMFPALLIGVVVGVTVAVASGASQDNEATPGLVVGCFWALFYGLALHAAAFFMPRGIRLVAWAFIVVGLLGLFAVVSRYPVRAVSPHLAMG